MQGCRHPSVFPASPPSFRHPPRRSGIPPVVPASSFPSPPSLRHPSVIPAFAGIHVASPVSYACELAYRRTGRHPLRHPHPVRHPGIPSVIPASPPSSRHPLRHPGIPSVIPASPRLSGESRSRRPPPSYARSWRKGALRHSGIPPVFPAKAGIHVAPRVSYARKLA